MPPKPKNRAPPSGVPGGRWNVANVDSLYHNTCLQFSTPAHEPPSNAVLPAPHLPEFVDSLSGTLSLPVSQVGLAGLWRALAVRCSFRSA